MTIYNLTNADKPILTADMANPKQNESSKEVMMELGAMMFIMTNVEKCAIAFNSAYPHFRIPGNHGECYEIGPEEDAIYNSILERKGSLASSGVEVIEAPSVLEITGADGKTYTLDKPLRQLAVDPDKPLHKLLGM